MLTASLWLVGLAVAGGLGLSCFYLLERRIEGLARIGSYVHGAVGASGVGLLAWSAWRLGDDPNGFGKIAVWLLGATLAAGLLVLTAQLRRRRASGAVVALHATLGVSGFVILVAFASR